jgi:hypothetical protein
MWHVWGEKPCKVLAWRPEVKRLLGGPRQRWDENFKIYFKEINLMV